MSQNETLKIQKDTDSSCTIVQRQEQITMVTGTYMA
jgi:hypothetical protein